MKVTTPNDKLLHENKYVRIYILEFENLLKDADNCNNHSLKIYSKLNKFECSKIEQIYKNAGWINVSCVCNRYFERNEEWYETILKLTKP